MCVCSGSGQGVLQKILGAIGSHKCKQTHFDITFFMLLDSWSKIIDTHPKCFCVVSCLIEKISQQLRKPLQRNKGYLNCNPSSYTLVVNNLGSRSEVYIKTRYWSKLAELISKTFRLAFGKEASAANNQIVSSISTYNISECVSYQLPNIAMTYLSTSVEGEESNTISIFRAIEESKISVEIVTAMFENFGCSSERALQLLLILKDVQSPSPHVRLFFLWIISQQVVSGESFGVRQLCLELDWFSFTIVELSFAYKNNEQVSVLKQWITFLLGRIIKHIKVYFTNDYKNFLALDFAMEILPETEQSLFMTTFMLKSVFTAASLKYLQHLQAKRDVTFFLSNCNVIEQTIIKCFWANKKVAAWRNERHEMSRNANGIVERAQNDSVCTPHMMSDHENLMITCYILYNLRLDRYRDSLKAMFVLDAVHICQPQIKIIAYIEEATTWCTRAFGCDPTICRLETNDICENVIKELKSLPHSIQSSAIVTHEVVCDLFLQNLWNLVCKHFERMADVFADAKNFAFSNGMENVFESLYGDEIQNYCIFIFDTMRFLCDNSCYPSGSQAMLSFFCKLLCNKNTIFFFFQNTHARSIQYSLACFSNIVHICCECPDTVQNLIPLTWSKLVQHRIGFDLLKKARQMLTFMFTSPPVDDDLEDILYVPDRDHNVMVDLAKIFMTFEESTEVITCATLLGFANKRNCVDPCSFKGISYALTSNVNFSGIVFNRIVCGQSPYLVVALSALLVLPLQTNRVRKEVIMDHNGAKLLNNTLETIEILCANPSLLGATSENDIESLRKSFNHQYPTEWCIGQRMHQNNFNYFGQCSKFTSKLWNVAVTTLSNFYFPPQLQIKCMISEISQFLFTPQIWAIDYEAVHETPLSGDAKAEVVMFLLSHICHEALRPHTQ